MVKQNKLLSSIFFLLLLIVFTGVVWSVATHPVENIQASAAQNTIGFAWSDTIGWISFNSRNCDTDNNGFSDGDIVGCPAAGAIVAAYGVNSDLATGNISGYAWSENIGWIDFDAAGPYPSNPQIPAEFNAGSGKLSGWARALSNGGGWDGWVKMARGPGDPGVNYEVQLNKMTGMFEGYAWGSDVVGWLSYNCSNDGVCGTSNYKVMVNNMPVISNAAVIPDGPISSTYCDPVPAYTFTWDFTDSDFADFGDVQASFQIQIDNNSDFSSLETNNTTTSGISSYVLPVTAVGYDGVDHYWRIRAYDSRGSVSLWTTSLSGKFTTPVHQYPDAIYSYLPSLPSENEAIQFYDESVAYGSGVPISVWGWIFRNVDDSILETSSLQTPSPFIFPDTGNVKVELTVTDSTGYICTLIDNSLFINIELPEWREVVPN